MGAGLRKGRETYGNENRRACTVHLEDWIEEMTGYWYPREMMVHGEDIEQEEDEVQEGDPLKPEESGEKEYMEGKESSEGHRAVYPSCESEETVIIENRSDYTVVATEVIGEKSIYDEMEEGEEVVQPMQNNEWKILGVELQKIQEEAELGQWREMGNDKLSLEEVRECFKVFCAVMEEDLEPKASREDEAEIEALADSLEEISALINTYMNARRGRDVATLLEIANQIKSAMGSLERDLKQLKAEQKGGD